MYASQIDEYRSVKLTRRGAQPDNGVAEKFAVS
jgi:hypothetical protein